MTVRARVRGIYATALTRLLREKGIDVVQFSGPIAARFGIDASIEGYDAAIVTTDDRLGVGVRGDPEAVGTLCEHLGAVGIDAFAWRDETPTEALFEGRVTETRTRGAIVDLGSQEGYLPANATGEGVEEGERYRVQVRESAPPWSDERPRLATDVRLDGGGLLELSRANDLGSESDSRSESTSKALRSRSNTGVGSVVDLLPTDVPDGWRARPADRAEEADFDALDEALTRVVGRAESLDRALAAAGGERGGEGDADGSDSDESATSGPTDDASRRIWTGPETAWVRFGRESRFALDDHREAVTATMAGHHRIKAGSESASAAVDFVESVCGAAAGESNEADADGPDFPFDVTTRQFGPREGSRLSIAHGKPDGREITLGRGEVVSVDPDGTVVLRREMSSGGTYDALGTERRAGDVAITRLKEGRWWYQTRYQSADGDSRGTYVNICTPVEIFPNAVRYVDLYVDVVRRPDGEVERVDSAELDAAVTDGLVGDDLAAKARSVADAIERAL